MPCEPAAFHPLLSLGDAPARPLSPASLAHSALRGSALTSKSLAALLGRQVAPASCWHTLHFSLALSFLRSSAVIPTAPRGSHHRAPLVALSLWCDPRFLRQPPGKLGVRIPADAGNAHARNLLVAFSAHSRFAGNERRTAKRGSVRASPSYFVLVPSRTLLFALGRRNQQISSVFFAFFSLGGQRSTRLRFEVQRCPPRKKKDVFQGAGAGSSINNRLGDTYANPYSFR